MNTSMHSSRMRTARLLPACTAPGGGVCAPGRVSASHGMSASHRSVWPGVSGRGVSAQGVSAQRRCLLGGAPLWTEFLTHASENITLP